MYILKLKPIITVEAFICIIYLYILHICLLLKIIFFHIIYSDYGFLPATPPSSIAPFYPIQIHSLSVSH